MIVGGAMLLVGWVILMGIVVEVIPAHIVLSMSAYALTLIGFMVGMMGAIAKIRIQRSRDKFDI